MSLRITLNILEKCYSEIHETKTHTALQEMHKINAMDNLKLCMLNLSKLILKGGRNR